MNWGSPIKFKSALDSCELNERSGKYAMKGFVGVTDNDWFAYVTLLKQDWPKAQGLRLKAFRSNWPKARMGEWNKGVT